jgi:hypothetical protein
MSRVRVTAVKRGTFVSAATGRIHHFDPNGSDPDARHPTIDMRDLDDLKGRGLIGDRAKGSAVAAAAAPTLDDRISEQLARAAEIDAAAGVGVSPAASVALNAYPPSMGVGGDEDGISEGDPDAPPVGARTPTAAPAKAEAPPARKPPAPRKAGGTRRSGGRTRAPAKTEAPAAGD